MNPNTFKKRNLLIVVCLLASVTVLAVVIVGAQPRVPLHRLGYRDLGYPFFSEIPADGRYITSLAAAADGRVYGATTGFRAYLFAFSPTTDQVKPLGHLPGCEGVHHSLVVGKDGRLFLGGGKNVIQPFIISKRSGGGLNWVSADLWQQVEEQYRGYEGGHLYVYAHAHEEDAWREDRPLPVVDLGMPVPGDGIYCLAIDPEREILYGISYPHGHFFVHELKGGTTKDLGEIFRDILFGGPDIRTLRSLPRNLAVDKDGSVYASTDGGKLTRYNPETKRIQTLEATIPGEGMQVVEAWAVGDEVLYGGTSEGFIFRFDSASQKLDNLGKPLVSHRIRGLALGKDGRLFGLGGDRHGVNRLFVHDPQSRSFEVLGSVEVDRSPYYAWRGQQFDAMVTSADGTIFMGESDRGGHLFFFIP
jgi:outer membrane protein assembly factor BamB